MNYKVVIIDDEPWTREAIKSVGNWGELNLKIVGEASDGEYGLELIRQVHPDIIITDVRMPRLNGIDLVEILRSEYNEAQVIIISGYDEFTYIRSALKFGVSDYLLKPVKPEELNQQLRKCICKLEEKEQKEQSNEIEMDFFKSSFTTEFIIQKDKVYHALLSGKQDIIEKNFDELKLFIDNLSQEKITKGTVIGIYYSLMSAVQGFIFSNSCTWEKIFTNENISFVFSQNVKVIDILEFMEHIYKEAGKRIFEFKNARDKLDIEKVEKYIEENYTEAISLEKTACEFFVSKEYLSKTFKEKTGKGFSEYVTTLRMEKAVELIHQYKLPIKEVGYLVGYVDLAHFYKNFKHFWGKTPKEMREELKIDNKRELD